MQQRDRITHHMTRNSLSTIGQILRQKEKERERERERERRMSASAKDKVQIKLIASMCHLVVCFRM